MALRVMICECKGSPHAAFPAQKAFIIACKHGHLEVCRLLFEAFGKHAFDLATYDVAAMYCAAESGNLELCEWLLHQGGERVLMLEEGVVWSMMHVALRKRHEHIVKWMLDLSNHIRSQASATEAFVLAARSEMWWALPRLIPPTICLAELKCILWNTRHCLEHVLPVLPRALVSAHCVPALTAMLDADGTLAVRSIFAALAKHGFVPLPRFATWNSSASARSDYNMSFHYDKANAHAIMSLSSKLEAMHICVSTWFPAIATAEHTSECTPGVGTWLSRHASTSHCSNEQELSAFLTLLARSLFGDLVRYSDLTFALLRVRLPATADDILEKLRFVAEHAVAVSVPGLLFLMEMKSRGILSCSLRHVHLAPRGDAECASLLARLHSASPSAPGYLDADTAWQAFRIIFGSRCVSEYVATGAVWVMRARRRATVAQLICNMHRALVQETWLNDKELAGNLEHMGGAIPIETTAYKRRYCLCASVMQLLACMDGAGRMFAGLPLRAQYVIYSFIFCVPAAE